MVMADRHNYLGCQILGRSTQSESPIVNLLSEAKVSYFHVSISGNEEVLWLKITICNLLLVKILEC